MRLSPRQQATGQGLLAQDLILSVDGRRVFTKEQAEVKVVSSKDPGDMSNLGSLAKEQKENS